MQTMDLAELYPDSSITGLDYYETFLDQLEESCRQRKIENIITCRGSMTELPFKPDTFDLIWSEGAIYIMGFEEGLKEWRRFLKKDGCIAVTELTWLTGNRPDEIRKYWFDNYPDMKDIRENLEIIEKTGYRIQGVYVLPAADWTENYYNPLLENMQKEVGRPLTEGQMNCLGSEYLEMQMQKDYPSCFSYVFYVMQKA